MRKRILGVVLIGVMLGLGGCVTEAPIEEPAPHYAGPVAPVVITSGNAGEVAWRAYDLLDGMDMDVTGLLAELPVTSQVADGAGSGSGRLGGPLARLEAVLSVLPELQQDLAGMASGLRGQGWLDCAVGGVAWEADQAVPGAVSPGDRYVLDFVGCERSGVWLDGRVIVTIDTARGERGVDGFRLAGAVRFEALAFDDGAPGLQDGRLWFDEWVEAGVAGRQVSGDVLYLRHAGEAFRYHDFTFRREDDGLALTLAADYRLDSTLLGGHIAVSTPDAFVDDGAGPWRGRLRVQGAGGAWLELDAEPDARHVTLRWDITPPVDDLADGVETLPWADLPWWTAY